MSRVIDVFSAAAVGEMELMLYVAEPVLPEMVRLPLWRTALLSRTETV